MNFPYLLGFRGWLPNSNPGSGIAKVLQILTPQFWDMRGVNARVNLRSR